MDISKAYNLVIDKIISVAYNPDPDAAKYCSGSNYSCSILSCSEILPELYLKNIEQVFPPFVC
jgi:hypothetical protein